MVFWFVCLFAFDFSVWSVMRVCFSRLTHPVPPLTARCCVVLLQETLQSTSGSYDMKPQAFQQAVINLGRLLELREQVGAADVEEQRSVQRWSEVR